MAENGANWCAVILVVLFSGCGNGRMPPSEAQASEGQEPATQGGESVAPAPAVESETRTYQKAIESIATDIEALKPRFPQLAEFAAKEHCDIDRLAISYGFKTHRSTRRGGWTAAVPNPDKDGVWFYIDFHEPDSMAQIHTQPVVPRRFFQSKKVMFLILEGEETENLAGALDGILRDRGVRDRPSD